MVRCKLKQAWLKAKWEKFSKTKPWTSLQISDKYNPSIWVDTSMCSRATWLEQKEFAQRFATSRSSLWHAFYRLRRHRMLSILLPPKSSSPACRGASYNLRPSRLYMLNSSLRSTSSRPSWLCSSMRCLKLRIVEYKILELPTLQTLQSQKAPLSSCRRV